MSVESSSPVAPVTFEDDVARRVPAIQDLFSQLIEHYCGTGDAPVSAICERIGLHRKLAWQLRSAAYAPDPFQAVRFMPTRAGLDTVIGAMQKLGSADGWTLRLRQAADALDALVEAHAGDRTNLEMLVDAWAPQPDQTKWREKAFLGNCFIWGAQTKAQLSISVLRESKTRPGWIDIAQIRGLVGLRRMRPNVHWLVNQSIVIDDRADVSVELRREPLDEAAAEAMGGVPILPAFCSSPLPRLRRRPVENGLINDELLPAPVGSQGQQHIVTGEVIRNLAPAHATHQNKRAHFGAVSRTPSELFLLDHFVHRDLFPGVERELCVFGELNSPVTQDDDDLLPVSEQIESLGTGLGSARTPDVPRYPELLRWIF
ncbi:MAG: hypothetical protein KC729_21325, partial [Candidatus Eisenbacteria bacterium]|nr:hypothetical protein [Candidatus Eisenbacteria bacterium]